MDTITWHRRTVRITPRANGFGVLALYDSDFLDREVVGRLTKFFYRNSTEAQVARKIIDQMSEAARQTTWEATELLVSTILEAILRTLLKIPFVPNSSVRFKAELALEAFTSRYLSENSAGESAEVVAAWRRLRHKNAHPTWLTGFRRNDDVSKAVLADLALLWRFYGVMILGMAGKRDAVLTLPQL